MGLVWGIVRAVEPLPRHNFSVLALSLENLWFMAFCWFCQITCTAFCSSYVSLGYFLVVLVVVVVRGSQPFVSKCVFKRINCQHILPACMCLPLSFSLCLTHPPSLPSLCVAFYIGIALWWLCSLFICLLFFCTRKNNISMCKFLYQTEGNNNQTIK